MKGKKGEKHNRDHPVKCQHQFHERDDWLEVAPRYEKFPMALKMVGLESHSNRGKMHLISTNPQIVNVDHTARTGGQKYNLFGSLPHSYDVDIVRVSYSASVSYKSNKATWSKVNFKNQLRNYNEFKLKDGERLNTSNFQINKFPFVFGKVSKNGQVFSTVVSFRQRGTEKWPLHLHMYLKKNNRIENPKYQVAKRVYFNCFCLPVHRELHRLAPINLSRTGVNPAGGVKPGDIQLPKLPSIQHATGPPPGMNVIVQQQRHPQNLPVVVPGKRSYNEMNTPMQPHQRERQQMNVRVVGRQKNEALGEVLRVERDEEKMEPESKRRKMEMNLIQNFEAPPGGGGGGKDDQRPPIF